jgi:hypothetical protein
MRQQRLKMQMNCCRVSPREGTAEAIFRSALENIGCSFRSQRSDPLVRGLLVETRKLRCLHRSGQCRNQQRRGQGSGSVVESFFLRI